MEPTTYNPFILGALVVGGLGASWRYQYQSVMYVLAVGFGVADLQGFLLASFLYLFVCLASGLKRAASS